MLINPVEFPLASSLPLGPFLATMMNRKHCRREQLRIAQIVDCLNIKMRGEHRSQKLPQT